VTRFAVLGILLSGLPILFKRLIRPAPTRQGIPEVAMRFAVLRILLD
jgi:hypothetical protein